MDIEHMREFVELSRQLNFTATAKVLHITQPALSNHIRALERAAGVILVERSSRGMARLTPAGQSFLEMAGQVVALYDATVPNLHNVQREIEGRLTIRSPRNEYSRPLLDYIYEFRRKNPKVDVVILPWSDADGIEDVVSGAVDFGYVGQTFLEGIATDGDAWVSFVPYAVGEILLWVDRSCELANAAPLSHDCLTGRSLVFPANKKRTSWEVTQRDIINHYGLGCVLAERYCDSLEDFMLTKVWADDIMLCSESWADFPPYRMRDERVVRGFEPPLEVPYVLCYRASNNNPIVETFAAFLSEKCAV